MSRERANLPDPRRWLSLAVLLLAAFMNLVDVTIVNVALPSIQTGLNASYAQAQWIVAGYILTFALGLIPGGRLGDIVGRKRMFLGGVAGFTLASTLCGLAPNPTILVTARVLQGLMAAAMVPQVLAIIQVSFPPKEWGTAFGFFGAAAGLATVTGPIVGGLLISANLFDLAWRPIFLVNVPVGLLALLAATALISESRSPEATSLDLPGVGLVTVGLLLLVYPLVQGRDLGWPRWAFLSMSAAVLVLGLFALWEKRKARIDEPPLVSPSLFKQRAFVAGLLITLIFFSGITGFFLVIAVYLQDGLGFTALRSGLTIVPFSVGVFAASTASAALAPRFGRGVLSAGTLLLAAGMAGIMWTLQRYGVDVTSWEFLPALLVAGVGMGLVVAPLFDFILTGVDGRDAGIASGVLNAVQQVGNAVGVAIIGVVFFGTIGGQGVSGASTPNQETLAQTFTLAMQWAVGYDVVVFIVCFGLIFLLPKRVHRDEAAWQATLPQEV